MSPHKSKNDNDLERGKRFLEIRKKIFEKKSRREVGEILGGYSQSTIQNWEDGTTIPNDAIVGLYRLGVDVMYLLSGESSEGLHKDAGLTEAQKTMLEIGKKIMNEGLETLRKGEEVVRKALTDPQTAKRIADKGMEAFLSKTEQKKKAN